MSGTEGQPNAGQDSPNTGAAADGNDPNKAPVEGQQASTPPEGEKNSPPAGETDDTKGKQAEGEGSKESQAKDGAPEAYEFNIPEGFELDETLQEEFSAYAKEKGFSQEDVNKQLEFAERMLTRQTEIHRDQVEAWAEEVRKDKELGGDKLKETQTVARGAIEKFGTPELKALLDSTGLGNHPELVKFAYRVGKQISEDGFVAGAVKREVDKGDTPAKRLYPNMN